MKERSKKGKKEARKESKKEGRCASMSVVRKEKK